MTKQWTKTVHENRAKNTVQQRSNNEPKSAPKIGWSVCCVFWGSVGWPVCKIFWGVCGLIGLLSAGLVVEVDDASA